MINADARQHGTVRVHRIHRVQPPTQANFQDGDLDAFASKQPQGGERPVFEVRQRDVAAHRLDRRERFAKGVVACLGASYVHALVVAHEVRRRVKAGAIAPGAQHGFEERAARAFAIRAADGDDGAGELDSHASEHGGDPFQSERDGLRVLALDELEPFAERFHATLSW